MVTLWSKNGISYCIHLRPSLILLSSMCSLVVSLCSTLFHNCYPPDRPFISRWLFHQNWQHWWVVRGWSVSHTPRRQERRCSSSGKRYLFHPTWLLWWWELLRAGEVVASNLHTWVRGCCMRIVYYVKIYEQKVGVLQERHSYTGTE